MESITSQSYGGRYLKLTVWQKGTEPNVYWKLESIGSSSQYYNISPITVIIDGKTVWSHAATDWSDKVFPAATGVYPSDRAGWTENIGSYKRVPFYLQGRPGYSDAGKAVGNVITLVAPTYTVTLDNCDLPAGTKQYDVPYTLPTPIREGQVFKGWLDAEGELRPAGYQYTANANATFTADWAPAITTLNFDGNGGTLSNPTLELELNYGESLYNRIGTLQTVTREEGYTFGGWQVDLGGDKELIYDANGNYVVGRFWKEYGFFNYVSDGEAITARAVWSPRTYNVNLYGTSVIPYTATKASTLAVDYGNGTTFSNVTPPIPDGYEFTDYWIDNLSKAVLPYYNPVIPIDAVTGTTLNTPGDRTFYAIYHDITPSKVVLSKSGYGKIATETSLDDYCDVLFSGGEIPETGDDIFGYFRFTTSDNNPCALSDSFDFEMTNHEGSEIPSTTISYVVRYSGNDTIIAFRTTYVDTEDVYHASLSNVFDELHKPVGMTFILDIIPAICLLDIDEEGVVKTYARAVYDKDDGSTPERYALISEIGDSLYWDDIKDKPSTFPPSAHTHDEKQDALVSGTNIRTVGSESILGSGNLNIFLSACSARGSNNETLNQNTPKKLTLTTFIANTDSDAFEIYDGGIRCKRAGTVSIGGACYLSQSTAGAIGTYIYLNSSEFTSGLVYPGATTVSEAITVSPIVTNVSEGDVFYLYGRHTASSGVAYTGNQATHLSIMYVDRCVVNHVDESSEI